jgi:hypothetical protein
MTKEQIDFHIKRLLSGEFILDGNDDDFLFLKVPSKKTQMIADKLCGDNDLGMTQEELDKFLEMNGYWTMTDEVDLKNLQESLENMKLDLWYEDVEKRDVIRNKIKKTNLIISQLIHKLHNYDYLLKSYIGISIKSKYMLSKSVFDENDNPVMIDNIYLSIDSILQQYFNNRCNDNQLREISLSEPWRRFWEAAKENNGAIFTSSGSDLTDEQISLISWTKFFDNVREHPEFPGEEVLFDEDLFDGWCFHQKNKRSGEMDKRDINSRITDNIKGCGEVFLIRQHEENSDKPVDVDQRSFVNKVEKFNDGLARGAKAARAKAIREKGIVNEIELPDNQRDIAMVFANKGP